jgi:hypothetical protein
VTAVKLLLARAVHLNILPQGDEISLKLSLLSPPPCPFIREQGESASARYQEKYLPEITCNTFCI